MHLFTHRQTHAVRRGPWVSMQCERDGRLYYLSLRTGATRWDAPPLWDVAWVRRAPSEEGRVLSRAGRQVSAAVPRAQVPAAVPRAREVCGGAAVGYDLAVALRPELALLLRSLRGEARYAAGFAQVDTPARAPDPDWSRYSGLCALAAALLDAVRERFALAGMTPCLSLTSLCPAVMGDVARAGVRADVSCSLQELLGSTDLLARALLPAITAVGGFSVYG